ncbi:MAG: glycosyltransferase family 2 protein [Verrucomicrobiales bacterium]|nr:glycosyltransferase family 2 protein [Verrucomicrobiales bacterium]
MVPLPISVCMVSGAEAHRIGPALASVAGWTRELIVVLNADTQDGTERMVHEQGGNVFREPWKGFIGQKNSAAAKATEPWVLNVDADEVVSGPLRAGIETLFAAAGRKPPHAAYEFPRCTLYHGRWIRHGDWYPDRVRRLWRKDAGLWAGVDPHARLEVRGTIGRLRGDLLHYSMETYEHQIAKTIAYAEDFVRHCAATGQRVGSADLWIRPAWRFVRSYVFRLGFLDGWQGYSIAWMTAFYTFLRYAKARAAQAGDGGKPSTPAPGGKHA